MKNPIKKLLMATALCTSLSACGGGGGAGGAVGTIQTWVQEDLTTLAGAESNIAQWQSLINTFSASVEGSGQGSLQSIITGPDAEDRAKATKLLELLTKANQTWEDSNTEINKLSDKKKYEYLNSVDYKNAYKAIQFLNNNVKPLIQKVANGNSLTVTELTSMDTKAEGDKIMNTYSDAADSYVAEKIIKKVEQKEETTTLYNEIEDGAITEEPINEWTTINAGGGKEKRDYKKTTKKNRVVKTQKCTWTTTTKLTAQGSENIDSTKTCEAIKVVTTPLADAEETITKYQEGENPVVSTKQLDNDTPINRDVWYGEWTVNNWVGTVDNDDVVEAQTEIENTTFINKTKFESTDNPNKPWQIVDKYKRVTTTKPIITTKSQTKKWEDVVYDKKKVCTIETKRKEVTYKDGTTEIIKDVQPETCSDWQDPVQKSKTSRDEYVLLEKVNGFLTPDVEDTFVSQTSKVRLENAYTNEDAYLGNKTPGHNTNKATYETNEYLFKDDDGRKQGWNELSQINASSAYSKGWTGLGSTVAIADTGYDVDHTEFSGQITATKDYTGTGINDQHGHGTHVLGTVVAKKDNSGMHGIAFDSKAIVIKIGNNKFVDINQAAQGFSWAADQGAVVGNLSANSNYDHLFRKNIEQLSDGTYKSTDERYDYANKTFYNMQTPDIWKTVTDKGMVVVNSAGNQGFEIAAHPGYFATVTDSNGNLVLGGKMLIVGAVRYTDGITGWSNTAGHLCVNIVNGACADPYKVSDFYVLAPGSSFSTKNDGSYGTMTGTSMAAPFVTGQVSILHQMWPHMPGESLVKLVTQTANKDIPSYNVNIHGQGIIDLDEATKPQGAIGIPTTGRTDGATTNISGSYISGSSSAIANLSDLNIMILDSFDRDYYMNLGNSVVVQDKRKMSDIDAMMNGYYYLPINQMYGSFAQGGQYDIGYMNFGLFTGESGNGDYSANIGKTFWVGNNFALKTNVGQMNEAETWLGNSSDGILAVGQDNITNYGQIGASYQIGNNVLSLDYSKGFTDINTTDGSLIKGFNNVETESYKLAYEIHKDKHNTFGWSFSLPSRITSGSMDLEVAESVNLDGSINYTTINSDLTQKKKEKNIGFFYNHTPTDDMDASFNFTAEYRQDVAGVEGHDGVNLAFNYVKKLNTNCKFLWMKNPKCYEKDENGKEVLKANLYGDSRNNNSIALQHGLVYDMKTDMFVPINKK